MVAPPAVVKRRTPATPCASRYSARARLPSATLASSSTRRASSGPTSTARASSARRTSSPAAARERERRFVMAGGFLYTTDHAVHYLVERAFPGYVKWNGKTSTEEIFSMEVGNTDRGLLKKIGSGGHPRWQLAGGGYLFDVVD